MDLLFIAHMLNGLLMVGLPIALGVYLARKYSPGWRIWWIGVATMLLAQVGHIPFNYFLSWLFEIGALPPPPEDFRQIFNLIVLGLSAGLWEEWFRYAAYRWVAKDARGWRKGLMMGAGHGGVEAIVYGILALMTFINLATLRNMDLSTVFPADQLELAETQVRAYWTIPWYSAILGAVERFFSLIFHLSASLLVLQAFLRRQIRWVWLAVLWHSAINIIALWAASLWGAYISETVLGLLSLVSLAIVFKFCKPELDPIVSPLEESSAQEPATLPLLPPKEESMQNIDDSKFDG